MKTPNQHFFSGSAVLWFNLMQSGEIENLMRHATCPVIAGEKWVCLHFINVSHYHNFKLKLLQVATKWIKEHGQEFHRPCFPENVFDRKNENHIDNFY